MQTLDELIRSIIAEARRPVAHDMDYAECNIRVLLSSYLDAVFHIAKNINETSIGQQDRALRIIELQEKFGLPKTFLL